MKFYLIALACVLTSGPALAQHMHGNSQAQEMGQSQFAAISEIVAVLSKDASTDWSQVDIGALREHLVDMDNVTTHTAVETRVAGPTVTFLVTGEGATVPSVQRMVSAHAPMLQAETGWKVDTQPIASGVQMSITSQDADSLKQISGLGFYGVMTIGAHHQQHHMMIALGHDPH